MTSDLVTVHRSDPDHRCLWCHGTLDDGMKMIATSEAYLCLYHRAYVDLVAGEHQTIRLTAGRTNESYEKALLDTVQQYVDEFPGNDRVRLRFVGVDGAPDEYRGWRAKRCSELRTKLADVLLAYGTFGRRLPALVATFEQGA